MIYEIISMQGYGIYVWSAFIFTLISFAALYVVIKLQLVKEEKRFKSKFKNLAAEKIESAKKQETYREILAYKSISKI
tara:strand:- start:264 stop:497 length:234 start_codon:yes stop_codon:yes gene_type:complete